MKHKTGRKLLSFLLTLSMVVGLMSGMGLTAYAANTYSLVPVSGQLSETYSITPSEDTLDAVKTALAAEMSLDTGTKEIWLYYDESGYIELEELDELDTIYYMVKSKPQEIVAGKTYVIGDSLYFYSDKYYNNGALNKGSSIFTDIDLSRGQEFDYIDASESGQCWLAQFGSSLFVCTEPSGHTFNKSVQPIGFKLADDSGDGSTAQNYIKFEAVYASPKTDQTVTAPTAVSGLTYTGSAQTLISAATVTTGNTAEGSITYSLDGTNYSTDLPKGTDAGTYTVYYKVAGNDNYNEFVGPSPVSVSIGSATVAVTGVTLDKNTAQTINVDGKVSFTATVAPDNATDKKVKWSVGGTDAGAVKLYTDEACTIEVGADATETLTVYAKGISAGSATVTATSNADSNKSASCDVTVNAQSAAAVVSINIQWDDLYADETRIVGSYNGEEATFFISGTVLTNNTGKTLRISKPTDDINSPTWNLANGDSCTLDGNYYTVTADEGYGETSSIVFYNYVPVTGIEFSSKPLSVAVGEEKFVQARTIPADATRGKVSYTSSNAEIAKITEKDYGSAYYVTGVSVGTATITATSVSDPTKTTTYTVTVTSASAPATVTKAPTAKSLTYNGSAQELVTAGTATGGEMQYALGDNPTTAPSTGWDTVIPTGKAVGTYYVWYKVVGDADHSDSAAAKVPVTIGPTPLTAQGVTIYAIPDQNYDNGNEIKPAPVVKHLGYLLKENEDYTLSYANNVNRWESGENPPTVTVTGIVGYSGTLDKTFKIILPAYSGTLTVTEPSTLTYGDALGTAPTVSGAPSGETVTVYYATTPSGAGTAWSSSARLNAGTYYVWAELAATGTHDKATSARVPFTVSKATPAAPSGVLRASYTDTYKVTLTIPGGKTYADYEYAVSTSESTPTAGAWKSLPALTGGSFTPVEATAQNTTYHVFLRTKADSNNNASAAATATLQTPAKVLLRYDANGSTASVPASVEYDSGNKVTNPGSIARAGYTFGGWYKESAGTNAWNFDSDTISANTTLYAKWTPNTYTVQYNANGGEGTISNGSFTYGTATALSNGSALSRSGYTFRGWATSASGDVVYSKSQKVSTLTTENNGTITLYAVWTRDTYEVSGTVMEELDGTTEQSIVAGVTVKIMRGNVQFGDTKTTDENGKYTFSGVPAGTYNIVATRTVDSKTQTMTALVEVKSDQKVDPIVLPPSKINSVLSVTGESTPPVMVGGLEAVAKDNAQENKEVTVTMTVKKEDESTATAEVKQQIEEIKEAVAADTSTGSGNTELEVLDVSVKKETKESSGGGSTTTENITETSQVVEIIVSFNMNGRFGFSLYRHHDGKAEPFQSRSNRFEKSSFADGYFFADRNSGLFYIYASRFSTYAIGYEEGTEPATTPTTTPTSTPAYSTGGGSSDSDDYINRVVKSDNGTVSVNRDTASNGEKVTITVKPDAGYETDTVTVSGSGSRNVAVTKVTDTTYTYIQPGTDVKINVTFRATSGTAWADCPKDSSCPLSVFSDADAQAWYHYGVHWALENGVMNGVGGGKFNPGGETSRAMVVTMLWRLEGSPAYVGQSSYADVSNTDWYGPAVRWADAEGIVTGYEQDGGKVFNPNGAVKREQLATMLYRYAQHKGQGFTGLWSFPLDYPDASSVSEWAYEAMCWMTMNGVINGMDGKLAPASGASRAQVATMLMRYCTSAAK